MIFNKHFEILKYYMDDLNKGHYGRELTKKNLLCQKSTALYLKELEKNTILKSKKLGNMKYYFLNIKNQNLKDILIITETLRKIEFFKKYRKLKEIFDEDERVIGLFGSYVKNTQTEFSDIDLFIIGKKQKQDYDIKGELYDLKINIKYFTKKEFKILLKQKNNLIKEIIKYHIVIFGVENFISSIWKDFYNFT